MSWKGVLAAAMATLLASAGWVLAQAELPPEGYEGRQYVDSDGCVFVRGAIDGAVTWVPRVNREREPICGQVPSFGAAETEPSRQTPEAPASPVSPPARVAEPAPEAAPSKVADPEPAVPRAAGPAPTAGPEPAADPASAPERVARPAAGGGAGEGSGPVPASPQARVAAPAGQGGPVAAPSRRPASTPAASAHVPVRAAQVPAGWRPKPVPAPRTLVVAGDAADCPRDRGGYRIRCETDLRPAHATGRQRPREDSHAARAAQPGLSPDTRILPAHLASARDRGRVNIPQGYKPAWDDGRLNPRRAEQSVRGFYAAQEIWSNTVPRRRGVGVTRDPVIVSR